MCGQLLKGVGYITPLGYVSVLLTIELSSYRVQIGGVFGTPNHRNYSDINVL